MKKYAWIAVVVVALGITFFVFFRFYYVFGEGVKSGELNYLVKKGNVFKTFEGKLIQSGLRPGTSGSIQSYEFEFSVTDDKIAETLMKNSGKVLDLHYKEYHSSVPWRGFSKYVVDSIYSMKSTDSGNSFR